MANRTRLQLKTTLASMWGYEDVADLLPQDLTDIEAFIDAALFDCYVPKDGSRAYWPEKYHTGILKAPVAAMLGMTANSAAVTGYAFEAAYFGSFVKIGEKFYRYNGAGSLLQPWDGDTGPQAATVYHNAIALPWSVASLAGVPNLLGIGLLGPLPDADAELLLRSEPAYDFVPTSNAREPFGISRNQFRMSSFFDVGDPRFYHIDQASVAATFALGNRFHVYPLPERVCTFEFRANIIPAALADGDTPAVPGNGVDNILLPIAREKLAMNSAGRRYTGPNVSLLIQAADDARAQLKSLRRVQTTTGDAFRLKRGW